MESGVRSRVPEPVAGIDIRSLPLVPEEAFVLTRVDGVADVDQICHESALSMEHVERALQKLAALGAIRYGKVVESASEAAQGAATLVSGRKLPEDRQRRYEALLAESVELAPALKKKILDLYYFLSELTYYELLGVNETADRQTIQQAYNDAVAELHPDRYYGRNLGNYKSRLERLFGHISEAYALLSDAKRRAEYDQILRDKRASKEKRSKEAAPAPPTQVAPQRPPPLYSSPLPQGPPPEIGSNTPTPVPTSFREAHPGEQALGSDEAAMRRTLARKLRHSVAPPSMTPRAAVPTDLQAKRDLADAGLKQLLRAHSKSLEPQAVRSPVPKAPESAKAPPPIVPKPTESYLASTVNLLRIAITREPDNPDIKGLLAELEQRIDDEAYVLSEQAEASERAGQFKEAAEAYAEAARCSGDASLYARAAECLLNAKLDFRKAGEYARDAVKLSPQRPDYRVLLARIYAAAGMQQSALTELQRAESLAPNDENIKQWMVRIAKETP